MKQHITKGQYYELERKEKFGYIYSTDCEIVEKLTIGKMIEILAPYYITICQTRNWYSLTFYLINGDNSDIDETVRFDSTELADALWEAVKYTLKQNEISVLFERSTI